MSVKHIIAAAGVALAGMTGAASAAPVTITVSGTLSSVVGGVDNTFADAADVGAGFTGFVSFDTSVPGAVNGQGGQDYMGGVTVSMTFDGNTIAFSSDAVTIGQDPSFAGARLWDDDTFGSNTRDRTFFKGQDAFGNRAISFNAQEQDPAPTMVGGDGWADFILAVTSGSLLANADFAEMTIENEGLVEAGFCFAEVGGCEVVGTVTSLTVAAVPLPAGGALLIAGLGGFAALRRFKK